MAIDPICNKPVVLLLGTSGALTFFAPIQLYIGIASVLLLGWTLLLRAKALTDTCFVCEPLIREGDRKENEM